MLKLVTQFDSGNSRVSQATPTCAGCCCCCCCIVSTIFMIPITRMVFRSFAMSILDNVYVLETLKKEQKDSKPSCENPHVIKVPSTQVRDALTADMKKAGVIGAVIPLVGMLSVFCGLSEDSFALLFIIPVLSLIAFLSILKRNRLAYAFLIIVAFIVYGLALYFDIMIGAKVLS